MEDKDKKILQEMLDVMFEKQTVFLTAKIKVVEDRLEPIAIIYDQTMGFNSVVKYIWKSIIIPLSIIAAMIISIKEILGRR